jgi:lysyl-tRNA synthetase class II
MLYRSHGKLAFAKILDSTNQIQLMFHRDQCKIIKTIKNQDGKMVDEAITELDFPENET